MKHLAPAAAERWRAFLVDVRRDAERAGIDPEDLASSLEDHLEQSDAEPIDEKRIESIIEELRADMAAELAAPRTGSAADGAAWRPAALSIGLLVLALASAPFVGPLLVIPSWVLSRFMANTGTRFDQLIRAPAYLYSCLTLLGSLLFLSYLPVLMLAEAGVVGQPWAMLAVVSLLAICSASALWLIFRKLRPIEFVLDSLSQDIRETIHPAAIRILLLAGACGLAASVAGVIHAA